MALVRQAPSADAFAQALTRNPNTTHLLDQLDDAQRQEVLRAITADVEQFVTPDGVCTPTEMLVGRGEA